MVTGRFQPVGAADRADLPSDGAGNADLLLDPRVDLADEVCIAVRSHHVGVCAETAVGLSAFGLARRVGAELRAEDARRLIPGFRVVIEDAGHADEALLQLCERGVGEAVAVAVDFVVTEDEVKEVDLIERVVSSGKCIELTEQLVLILFHADPLCGQCPRPLI